MEAIQAELLELRALHTQLSTELTDLVNLEQPHADGSLPEELQKIAHGMQDIVQMAADISEPVLKLESLKQRGERVLSYIEELMKAKHAMTELDRTMQAKDFDAAALNIEILLPLKEAGMLEHDEAIRFEKHFEWLCSTIKKQFAEAVTSNDQDMVKKVAQLFPPLGLVREGVDHLISYTMNDFNAKANEVCSQTNTSKFEHILVNLFRVAAKVKESCLIEKEFGAAGQLKFLQTLQAETDLRVVKLFESFSSAHMRSQSELLKRGELSMKEHDQLCESVARMIHHSESFENYLQRSGKITVKSAPEWKPESDQINPETGLLRLSELKKKLQEFANTYVMLEASYMQRAVTKSIESLNLLTLSENIFQSKEELSSSEELEGAFVVIQKCITRALSTYNLDNICATLNHINSLSEALAEHLTNKIKGLFKSQLMFKGTSSLSLSVSWTQHNASFILGVNMLHNTANYLLKLKEELEADFTKVYGSDLKSTQMFVHCVNNLPAVAERLTNDLNSLLVQAVRSMRSDVNSLMGAFDGLSFMIDEARFSEYEVNDPFMNQLISELKASLKQWKAQLNPQSFTKFVGLLASFIAESIEMLIRSKQFTEWGADMLHKDLLKVSKFFGSMQSSQPFARLVQISQVLLAASKDELSVLKFEKNWKLADEEMGNYWRLRR
mmetsp:Transcript_7385/g.13737  ORF Transcript_7385/g.13737 Transcript_7385/m.13737 type:complete len:671 (+) Transcript_7385:2363-4375(+)